MTNFSDMLSKAKAMQDKMKEAQEVNFPIPIIINAVRRTAPIILFNSKLSIFLINTLVTYSTTFIKKT